MTDASQRIAAQNLVALLEHLAVHHCGCIAQVSRKTCEEIIEHHERDLKRLRVLHPGGIHPSKHIAYLAFWVRKLKPISNAYHAASIVGREDTELPYDEEFVTINELVAVYLAQHMLLSYTYDGYLTPSRRTLAERVSLQKHIEAILAEALQSPLDTGHTNANVFAAFVYDMRYRTFGPHHIVHFINHAIFAALAREQAAARND